MILGTEIPLDVGKFVENCLSDARQGRFAKPSTKYLDYLSDQTRTRHPALYRFVKVLDRVSGADRYSADADHIIPKAVWNYLMPDELRGQPGEEYPAYSGVISNLFWRDKQFNRKDDNLAIKLIQEARSTSMTKAERTKWRVKWMSIFLFTKHDEGVLCTAEPTDPHQLDELIGPAKGTNWLAYGRRGK